MRAIAKELKTTKPQAHASPSVVYFESKPKPTKGQAVTSSPPAMTRAVPEKAPNIRNNPYKTRCQM